MTSQTSEASTNPETVAPPGGSEGRSRFGRVPVWALSVAIGVVVVVLAALFDFWATTFVVGATENAPLVLAAFGFALLYRLTGLLNVAYAETITLGAYFAVWMNNSWGLGFYVVLLPAGLLAGVLSVVTYLLIFRVAKGRRVGNLEMIVISFGLSIFLQHGLQFVFGYRRRAFDIPPPDTIEVFGVGVSSFRLLALASVAALTTIVYQFIQRTSHGLQIRALASNEGLAQASGVRPLRVTILIWFVAGLCGGLAGVFYGAGASVESFLGIDELLLILLVVLVGGIWGLPGVVVVGMATGVALTGITLEYGNSLYAELVLVVAFLGVLKFRGRRLTDASKV